MQGLNLSRDKKVIKLNTIPNKQEKIRLTKAIIE